MINFLYDTSNNVLESLNLPATLYTTLIPLKPCQTLTHIHQIPQPLLRVRVLKGRGQGQILDTLGLLVPITNHSSITTTLTAPPTPARTMNGSEWLQMAHFRWYASPNDGCSPKIIWALGMFFFWFVSSFYELT